MAREERQAMTRERLAEIRAQVEEAGSAAAEMPDPEYAHNLYTIGTELLAEVERLRAREAAQMEVVRAVADGGTIYYAMYEGTFCVLCNGYVRGNVNIPEFDIADYPHAADCPVMHARALLALAEGGEQTAQVDAFVCPGCGGHWRRHELGPTPDILRCPNCGAFCEPDQRAQMAAGGSEATNGK